MPAQPPYTPFENDRLSWLKADEEAAAPALSKLGGSKPSLLLFIGHGDKDHCCAKAFERAVFKDQSVVAAAKEHFIAVRLDRESSVGRKFEIKKPTLVILDGEGAEVARFDDCTEPRWVLPVFEECLKRTRVVRARTAEWAPRIGRAEALVEEGKLRDASALVAKALRVERLGRAVKDKLDRLAATLDEKAQARLDAAKDRESAEPIAAWVDYRSIRDEFWGLPGALRAKERIAALEKDPANKDRLKAAREAESAGKTPVGDD